MEITVELLKKYILNSCKQEEKEAIEKWLNTKNIETSDEFTSVELKKIKSEMWTEISSILPQEKPKGKGISLSKFISPYSIAASLVTFLLTMSIFIPSSTFFNQKEIAENGHLEIKGKQGPALLIKQDHCQLSFDGFIRLANTSSKIKTVTCGKDKQKTFQLAPGQTYYLRYFNGKPHLILEQHLGVGEDHSRYLRGGFSVHFDRV